MVFNIQCTICTGDFAHGSVSTCPCGHTFHEECIKKWLNHQRNCPICRIKCTSAMLTTLYFSIADDSLAKEVKTDEELKVKISILTNELNIVKEELRHSKIQIDNAKKVIESQKKALDGYDNLQKEYEILSKIADDYQNLKKECKRMVNRLKVCDFYKIVEESNGSLDPSIMDEFLKDREGTVNITKILDVSIKENRRVKRVLIEKQRENSELVRRKVLLESELKSKETLIDTIRKFVPNQTSQKVPNNYDLIANDSVVTSLNSTKNTDNVFIQPISLEKQLTSNSISSKKIPYEIAVDDKNDDQSFLNGDLNTSTASALSPTNVSSKLDKAIASKKSSNHGKKDFTILDRMMVSRANRIKRYGSNAVKVVYNDKTNSSRGRYDITGKKMKFI